MTLDSTRAARVRRMVPDQNAWPGGNLLMKNLTPGEAPQLGYIPAFSVKPNYIAIRARETHAVIFVGLHIEDLINADWAID